MKYLFGVAIKQESCCQFEITQPSTVFPRRITACTNTAGESGFCKEHAHAARLLEQARYYGCPELEMIFTQKRWNGETKRMEEEDAGGFFIRQGYHNWLAYCERATPEHAKMVAAKLEQEYGGMYGTKGVA